MASAQGATRVPSDTQQVGAKLTDVGPFKREDLSTYLTRVKKDIAFFLADPPTGIFIAPYEKDIANIHALVMGPSGTPYEDGFFEFLIRCPVEYPMKPPIVEFLTTDSGRVTFNPNLYSCGYVSLEILGAGWSPTNSARNYKAFVEHETIRVAVCDAVAACLSETSTLPATLRDVVLKKFLECYDRYEAAVKSKLDLSGKEMPKTYFYLKGTFEYAELLTRLRDLKQRVAEHARRQ
ncbi:hypothetical protein HPB51_016859 [Rhipicephalus microplus]|uniref:Ubiquitin-conjugating enzyme E2 Z n=1 Tax=Rhipicephalus microplus TaxID=6941 RepID=A0A9J6DHR8_RHIMP|nr:hypothetical protein HPB51_016859 [Rhipicephalus microplus]